MPLFLFPAPSKTSERQLAFVDWTDSLIKKDGLLLVERKVSGPLGPSPSEFVLVEIKQGRTQLPGRLVLGALWLWLRPTLPFFLIYPHEEIHFYVFIPGYHGSIDIKSLRPDGNVQLYLNSDYKSEARECWDVSNLPIRDDDRLINPGDQKRLEEFVRANPAPV
ncbi:MAG TPA: hypothetical protein VJZ71_08930 [Phycisphaerae bacterium]|nr:hypothetical protein [Phycisphaerae bacterium]